MVRIRSVQYKACPAQRKTIVAGKNQMKIRAVGFHPLGWEAAGFARTHVPAFCVERCRPWPPRFSRVAHGEAAGKPGVLAREDLAPDVSFQSGMIGHAGPVTRAGAGKDRTAIANFPGPNRPVAVDAHKE